MGEEPFEVRVLRDMVSTLKEREAVLAAAEDELGRVRAALADATKMLEKGLLRAGLNVKTVNEPGPETVGGKVLIVLRAAPGPMTIGVLTSRTHIPATAIRQPILRLLEAGHVKRVSHGTYEAVKQNSDE